MGSERLMRIALTPSIVKHKEGEQKYRCLPDLAATVNGYGLNHGNVHPWTAHAPTLGCGKTGKGKRIFAGSLP